MCTSIYTYLLIYVYMCFETIMFSFIGRKHDIQFLSAEHFSLGH